MIWFFGLLVVLYVGIVRHLCQKYPEPNWDWSSIDPDELEFPYERLTRFKDLEGHGMVVTNPASVKRQYLERLKKHLQGTRAACMERNVSYQLATTKTPYDQLLLAYLDRRARMKC